jgi:hypothetical protein
MAAPGAADAREKLLEVMSADEAPAAEQSTRRFGRSIRVLCLAAGCVLAVAATIVLIVTDNPKWLQGGLLIALWGCVLALLASARTRRHQDDAVAQPRVAEIQRAVQLHQGLHDDVLTLRHEIAALRRELAERAEGELRFEHFALRAESTRVSGNRSAVLAHASASAEADSAPSKVGRHFRGDDQPAPALTAGSPRRRHRYREDTADQQ